MIRGQVVVRCGALVAALVLTQAAVAQAPAVEGREALAREVAETERAFARTMAERDHAAFVEFLAEEAVFFSGKEALRGRQQIAAAWKPFYEEPDAPFSWAPEQVEVLDSGTLALTSGPVHDPDGRLVGRFTSIWRREAPGTWRIVFDKGCEVCRSCDGSP
jgi:ketosteroid isomerase-like protein